MNLRTPAEAFPPGDFILEELKARKWSIKKLATMFAGDYDANLLALQLLIYAPTKGMLLGQHLAEQLGKAFDIPAEFFLNLDNAWQGSKYK